MGRKIKVGDTLAYSYTRYKTADLQFGIVLSINRYRKNGNEITETDGYDHVNKRWNTKPSCTITVTQLQWFEGKWTDRKVDRGGPGGRSVLLSTPNTLKTWQNPNNVLKIEPLN